MLEIFVDCDGEVILKKYLLISELGDFVKEYGEVLYDSLGYFVFICDCDVFIVVVGSFKKEYLNKNISLLVEFVMESCSFFLVIDGKNFEFVDGYEENIFFYIIGLIIVNGDLIGVVVIFLKDKFFGEVEYKVVEIVVSFLFC